MNIVTVLGNLVRDVEVRTTKSGKSVAGFTLAVNEEFIINGETKEATAYVNCVAWGKQAEECAGLKKGSKVFATGRLNTRSYEAQDGTKKYITEVVCKYINGKAKKEYSNFDNFETNNNNEEFPF